MQKKINKILKITIITFFTFLLFDLLIGNYVYKKILRKGYFDVDTNMASRHPVYNHGLKKNYNTSSAGWGKKKFSFCSDNFGFRNNCNVKYEEKFFDVGIIGDSQTIGFGLGFEETFSSIISNNFKDKKFANLASSSYSPAIYYSKIKYLIENGFKFKEIIVFIDISDLHDDTTRYILEKDVVIGKDLDFSKENHNWREKLMKFYIKRRLKVTHYIIVETNNILEINNIKNKSIPYWVENNPRSAWTYNYDDFKNWYENKNLSDVILNSTRNMDKLYKLLNKNGVDLSIAVFPWPGTLKYDTDQNLQVQIWEEFCEKKCKKFYNFMTPFFKLKKEIGYQELYFKFFINGDIHLNENGHRLIAKEFTKEYN